MKRVSWFYFLKPFFVDKCMNVTILMNVLYIALPAEVASATSFNFPLFTS